MTEQEKHWARYFNDICPYTGKKCSDWNCTECEVEQAEREYMKESENEE